MLGPRCRSALLGGVLCLGTAVTAHAQVFESVGVRAQGLGGAFVAVADDATATWWNPAGVAGGPYAGAIVEGGVVNAPATPSADEPAWRTTTRAVSVVLPSMGLSLYRVRVSDTSGAVGIAPAALASTLVSSYGLTVGQSLGDHLVVATTLKLLRAGTRASVPASGANPLDAADALDVPLARSGDLDVGAMLRLGALRLGGTMHHVTEPTLQSGLEPPLTLHRQARVGAALATRPRGLGAGVLLSADADVLVTPNPSGDVRHAAGGAEAWLAGGRVGVRTGASVNTVGDRRPAFSTGGSVRVSSGLRIDVARTMGQDPSLAGWAAGLSVNF